MSQTDAALTASKNARAMLEATTPADFDGHTEFLRLTPEERLDWLWEAVHFIASRRQQQ